MDIKYFDNSATTQVKEEVVQEMIPYLKTEYGNPSAIYGIGRSAKRAIEKARERVARLINCDVDEIYFTSCGTESDNTAIKGIAYKNKKFGNHIITSKIEHPAILNSCKNIEGKGFKVTYINVDEYGMVDLNELESSITNDTILVSIMTANNEIGTIEPIQEIANIVHKYNIIFHTDSVQAIGNIDIDVKRLGIDMLSMSGHKIYAPKGVGALYVRKKVEFERFLDGGHQEKNFRSGTENVASIVGFGKACEIAKENLKNYQEKLKYLRDYTLSRILREIPNSYINGSIKNRLPGNINVSFEGVNSTELLYKLDSVGICASGGSACSSRDTKPSYVLTAIGVPERLVHNTIRITFGDFNKIDDANYLIENLKNIIYEIRNKS